jgi:hypothetical protein
MIFDAYQQKGVSYAVRYGVFDKGRACARAAVFISFFATPVVKMFRPEGRRDRRAKR